MLDYLKSLTVSRAFLLLLLFGILVTLAGLNVRELESGDETRVAGIAAEMFLEKSFLVPKLNGTPFLEYPPLYYWLISGSYAVFGINDLAAKLPSALAALAGALVLFGLARQLKFPPWASFAGGVMLLTSAQYFGNSRKCMVDMLLAFFVLLAVSAFYRMANSADLRRKALAMVILALALAGGIYTKGLLGWGMPLAIIGCWMLLHDILRRRITFSNYLLSGGAALLALGIAGIWYWELYRNGGREMLDTALFTNNIGRFSGSQGDHITPFYYYFEKLPTLFFPWLPLVFGGFWALWHQRSHWRENPGLLLPVLFVLVPFLLLTCAASKRTVYLLPLYAPCALLSSYALMSIPASWQQKFWYILRPMTSKIVWGVFIAGLLALLVLSRGWAMFYPLAALGGVALLWRLRSTAAQTLLLCLGLGLAVAALDTASATFLNPEESIRPLFEKCRQLEASGKRVVLVSAPERTRGAAYFYLRRNVKEVSELTAPPAEPNEVRIIRSRQQTRGLAYPDHHWLQEFSNGNWQ